jgi:hypothetical protein
VPDGARIFRRPFFNPDGEMTIMQWYTAENTLVDYRFAPRETKTETYTWQIPQDIAGDIITFEFISYYSLVPSSVGEFLELPEYYYDPFVTGSASLTLDMSGSTTLPDTTAETYGELAVKGQQIYPTCQSCHSITKGVAAKYNDAQKLFSKILTMPSGNKQVLSYFLVELGGSF